MDDGKKYQIIHIDTIVCIFKRMDIDSRLLFSCQQVKSWINTYSTFPFLLNGHYTLSLTGCWPVGLVRWSVRFDIYLPWEQSFLGEWKERKTKKCVKLSREGNLWATFTSLWVTHFKSKCPSLFLLTNILTLFKAIFWYNGHLTQMDNTRLCNFWIHVRPLFQLSHQL